MCNKLLAALTRKKTTAEENGSQLARVLNLFDLTALGVGSTLGLGVYILAGSVARNQAGPAVCISFLIAAVASAFAGLCYAEFAARVPKAGSAYIYSYVSVGEFAAFIIGWNLILEYVIGTASLARGLSDYIDALTNSTMSAALLEMFPINIEFLSKYPDFLSLLFIILLTVLLSSGVKESSVLNNVFTALNMVTVLTVIISGAIKANPDNWKISKDQIPSGVDAGNGGFMPFGVAGVIAGAAKCFYGFIGFDTVATTADEAINPKRNIPLAIIASLSISFVAYFGIGTVLTMMWPYYDQYSKAPFPYVFEKVGWITIKWIVTIGAVFALCTSLLGCMFPLPRVIYAMASDGLLFKDLSKVNQRTKTPIIATAVSGILAGIMGILFDVDQLVEMMSIGTLLAYTIVALCVLILRYEEEEKEKLPSLEFKQSEGVLNDSFFTSFKQLLNLNGIKHPSSTSSLIANWSVTIFCCLSVLVCAYGLYGTEYISDEEPYGLAGFIVVVAALIVTLIVLARQPVSGIELAFKVPWVPLIPCLSIIINVCLMMKLELQTWVRFVVWLAVGFFIYFFYGMWHSVARLKNDLQPAGTRCSSSISNAPTASLHSEKNSDHPAEKQATYKEITEF